MSDNGFRACVDATEPNGQNDKAPPRLNEAAQKYVHNLMRERIQLERNFPLAVKLIDEALERIQLNGRIPTREQYADVYQQRTIKLSQKVHVPIKDKKFNYVGKLLGPKGNSLRRLQEETQCKIVILGRFSMKDRAREEELRNSSDIKYSHLHLPLHVEISTIGPPAEAYARIAYALAEIRRYLIPDKHDEIRQEQYRELMEDPDSAKKLTSRLHSKQSNKQLSDKPKLDDIANRRGQNTAGIGNYRQKYQPTAHQFQQNSEITYRSQCNTVEPNPHLPGPSRGNSLHLTVPQKIVRGAPAGVVMAAAPLNCQSTSLPNIGVFPNNMISTGGFANNLPPNMRYRPNATYKFVKK